MLSSILKVTFWNNTLLLWLSLPEADQSVSLLKCALCWVNFVPTGSLWVQALVLGRAEELGGDFHPGLLLVSAGKKCWVTFLDMISHKLCLWGMVRNYRGFRSFLLMGDELCMWEPCSSKHDCSHCTETHPWTPKCLQTEIIYNSTSLCPLSLQILLSLCSNEFIDFTIFYQISCFRDKCPSFAVIKSAMSRTAIGIIV